MTHHWRASDELDPIGQGRWALSDHGYRIGYIERGRVNGRWAYRAILESGQVVGHEWELEACCTAFWNWYLRFVKVRRAS